MRPIVNILMVMAATLAWAAPGEASAITFTDTFDPADVTMTADSGHPCTGDNALDTVSGNPCTYIEYTHTLSGFDSSTDTLTGGKLEFWLYDDEATNGGNEKVDSYSISLGGTLVVDNSPTVDMTSVSISPLVQVQWGVLSSYLTGDPPAVLVRIVDTGANGAASDWFFDKSVLTATADRSTPVTTAVPEPGSLLLLGSGLAFAADGWRRRRKAGHA